MNGATEETAYTSNDYDNVPLRLVTHDGYTYAWGTVVVETPDPQIVSEVWTSTIYPPETWTAPESDHDMNNINHQPGLMLTNQHAISEEPQAHKNQFSDWNGGDTLQISNYAVTTNSNITDKIQNISDENTLTNLSINNNQASTPIETDERLTTTAISENIADDRHTTIVAPQSTDIPRQMEEEHRVWDHWYSPEGIAASSLVNPGEVIPGLATSLANYAQLAGLEGSWLHGAEGLVMIGAAIFAGENPKIFENSSLGKDFLDAAERLTEINDTLISAEENLNRDLIDEESRLLDTFFPDDFTANNQISGIAEIIAQQLNASNMILDGKEQALDAFIGITTYSPDQFTDNLLIGGNNGLEYHLLDVNPNLINGTMGGLEGAFAEELGVFYDIINGL